MIPDESFAVAYALVFWLLAKFSCVVVIGLGFSMHKRQHLSSIPEKNESEDEIKSVKWVPKKKHEVLKAKYKCLKKLFQIYDASVIGILPASYDQGNAYDLPEDQYREKQHLHRKKRSYRTKTDACAGTTEISSGDVSVRTEDKESIASAVVRDLKVQCSCSTQVAEDCEKPQRLDRPSSVATDDVTVNQTEYRELQASHPMIMMYDQRKPTRFQNFIQRLLGIRRERGVFCAQRVYAASDNNITYNCEKRHRRGLRFRRLKKAKRTHSETMLGDACTPTLLNYVQTIQRSCLLDRTPRQCPITGCKSMFYGIINYNDHLNLCHFIERKFVCHYCHEGFEMEYDKYTHENEHLGVTKLKVQNASATSSIKPQKSSITQTEEVKSDVPEEKLKKIVSFFDKIVDTDQMLAELNKNRYSESNLQHQAKTESESVTESETITSSDKRTLSCGNLFGRRMGKSKISNRTELTSKCPFSTVQCHLCGEDFDHRRQLSLHVNLEHGRHTKPSKFHSCAGLADYRRRSGLVKFEAGRINIQSVHDVSQQSSTTVTPDNQSLASRQKSDGSLSCDPSTNIIYFESMHAVKKPPFSSPRVDKAHSGVTSYRWEPGTKIIRV